MAVGDQTDIKDRLFSLLPTTWFPSDHPTLDEPLTGAAKSLSTIFSLIVAAVSQMRLSSATGAFLDLYALDFFGRRIRRRKNEQDDPWRARIKREMFRPRVTRDALKQAITDTTGVEPRIFEPANPADTGGLGRRGRMGFNRAGRYGSLLYPNTVFVEVFRSYQGIPGVNGLRSQSKAFTGKSIGGLNRGRIKLASLTQFEGPLAHKDIFEVIESVRPAGVLDWTRIH